MIKFITSIKRVLSSFNLDFDESSCILHGYLIGYDDLIFESEPND